MYTNLLTNVSDHHIEIGDATSNFKAKRDFTVRIVKCHPGYTFNGETCDCNTGIAGIKRLVLCKFRSRVRNESWVLNLYLHYVFPK